MTGVQKGGVEKTPQMVIKNDADRNRSVSDQTEWEKDLRELNDMYTECLWYMQEDNPYAEHIYDLQTYLEYCLGRKVNVIPEGWIPRKGHIDKLAYAKCLERITELLFTTGLLRELLELNSKTDFINAEAFVDE
ncbi:MAG: hypothetical protein J6U12_03660 [Candidatus Methanomethylophilaceae archaeon]|nr:hypothetical protein [Candidatus Methanomethylophilaceae archaeon]MBO7351994.1 hypothetical protein [Candidatus Methanomethylophilaceae archaeon]